MNLTILTSSPEHPVNPYISKWAESNCEHKIDIIYSKEDLTCGDILFLVSCSELVLESERRKYKKTLVLHASDLPYGRGWSPHVWEIINGADTITISLLEAEDVVDSGDVWSKVSVPIPETALFNEINDLVFSAELNLMSFAIDNYKTIEPKKQSNAEEGASYWPKRTPADSEIDIDKGIREQFNLMRVCDSSRFPAHFFLNGKKFNLILVRDGE